MPLDTSIARSLKPLQVQFRDLGADYNQLAQMQAAESQNQLAQMQMSAAQRTMQEEEGAKNFLSTSPDLNNIENQRRLLAFGKTGLAYGKAFLDQKKAGQDSDQTAAEILGLNQKNFTALNPPMRAAAGGIPGITAYIEAMYADPVLGALAKKIKPKEQALKENIEMYTKDADQWITSHASLEGQQLLDALKMNAANRAEADYQASRGRPVAGAPAAAAPGTVNATPVAPIAEKTAPLNIQEAGDYRFDRNISLRNQAKLIKLAGQEPLNLKPNEYFGENIGGGLEIKTLPAAAAPVANAMVAPAAPTPPAPAAQPDMANALAMKIQSLEAQRNQLEPYLKSSSAKLKYEDLGKQIDNLSKGFSISAGGAYTIPGVGTFVRPPTASEFEQLLTNSGMNEDQKKAARAARVKKETTFAPGVTVSVGAGEKAEEVEFRKLLVDQYKEVSARADVATRSLPALDINLKTLEKGFDTGFGTETIAAGAKVLAALGVQNAKDFATDAQTFLANANSAVLQKQLEQKGVQTAADADRITSTGAQLGNTKEANKFIISVAKAQLQRDIAQRKFYSDWRTENETFRGAEDAWYAGPGGASLFDSPILKKYIEPSGAALIPGSKPAAATGGNVVTLPDGRTKTFPTAEAANQFKKAAGL